MSTVKQWITTKQHAFERQAAPHVEPTWSRTLLLELRLRGVDGLGIGAVLAEVDSHCAESGESAAEAFGDPVAYARTLDLPADERTEPGALLAAGGQGALQVVGMLGVLWGVGPWLAGEALELTTGLLVLLVGVLVVLLVVVRHVDAIMRGVVHHPVRAWLVSMVGLAVTVDALWALDHVVLRVDAGWTALAGAALLLVGTALGLRSTRAEDVDPVVAPLGEPDGGHARTRGARLLALGAHLLLPVLTVVAVALTWVTGR